MNSQNGNSRYTRPPNGAVPHKMSDKTSRLCELIIKNKSHAESVQGSQGPSGQGPNRRRTVGAALGASRKGTDWDSEMKNPPLRKFIPPGRLSRDVILDAKNKKNHLFPPVQESLRARVNRPSLLKRPIHKQNLKDKAFESFGGNVNLGRADFGLPIQEKTVAKSCEAKELVICSLRFGENLYPRGMLYQDIIETMQSAYIVPNTPAFSMALSSALAHLVSHGVVSKSFGTGPLDSRYKIQLISGPGCGLFMSGKSISEVLRWPNGYGLPGSGSMVTRVVHTTPHTRVKPPMYGTGSNHGGGRGGMGDDYYERENPKSTNQEPMPFVPVKNMENPMLTQSFAERAGGLCSLKPDFTARPNTPVSGVRPVRGSASRDWKGNDFENYGTSDDDELAHELFAGYGEDGQSEGPLFRGLSASEDQYDFFLRAPPSTAFEEPDCFSVPGIDANEESSYMKSKEWRHEAAESAGDDEDGPQEFDGSEEEQDPEELEALMNYGFTDLDRLCTFPTCDQEDLDDEDSDVEKTTFKTSKKLRDLSLMN